MPHDANMTTLEAYGAYDIPSVDALIRYFSRSGRLPSPLHMFKRYLCRQLLNLDGPYTSQRHQVLPIRHSYHLGTPCSEKTRGPIHQDKATNNNPTEQALPKVQSNELHVPVTPHQ